MSRGWERRYQDFSTAYPAYAYNGYWNLSPEVRATWRARLADQKWTPDAGSGLRRPLDLQLQTPGSTPRPAERSGTVVKFDTQILRSGILVALGVKAGPTQSDLLDRLRSLQDKLVTPAIEAGRFIWPVSQNGAAVPVSAAQLGYLLEGIDWRSPRWTQRPASAG